MQNEFASDLTPKERSALLLQRRVGQRVICNGYPGTITRVCEWSDSMVEVRLDRGTTCVDFKELLPADRPSFPHP